MFSDFLASMGEAVMGFVNKVVEFFSTSETAAELVKASSDLLGPISLVAVIAVIAIMFAGAIASCSQDKTVSVVGAGISIIAFFALVLIGILVSSNVDEFEWIRDIFTDMDGAVLTEDESTITIVIDKTVDSVQSLFA